MSSPPAELQSPLLKTFWRRFWFGSHLDASHLLRDIVYKHVEYPQQTFQKENVQV